MRTELFDYLLPPELIAQEPLERRDDSRLMVVDRATGGLSHRVFRDLPSIVRPGDCLVLNTTRVFPARLQARKAETGGAVELLLLERLEGDVWSAVTGGARLRPGTRLSFDDSPLEAIVTEIPGTGKAVVEFGSAHGSSPVDELLARAGGLPLPPYIKAEIADPERYQTVYADREISAAAPTAGLHFTEEMMDRVRAAGADFTGLELAVGLDTFAPVREEDARDHVIHTEWFSVGEECARSVNRCGGRVVAVGTTSVRALESAAAEKGSTSGGTEAYRAGEPLPGKAGATAPRVTPRAGRTGLYIVPGYRFRVVEALLTNFHLPRSTLLMLVCAFGGTDKIMEAYRVAVAESYRFYSFGDAMMVV